MRLPIPFEDGGVVYTEAEFGAPSAGILADTQKAADEDRFFNALAVLCSGVITSISNKDGDSVEDAVAIRRLCKKLPYRSGELLALQALLLISPDDGFEGVYKCPRCSHEIITEYNVDEDEDTRDYVKDLDVGYAEGLTVQMDLSKPVVFTSGGEITDTIESISMRYPSISDCIKAMKRSAEADQMRQQFAIYGQAIQTVNGKSINDTWRGTYGSKIFERMDVKVDLPRVGDMMSGPGLTPTVAKRCPKCNKVWQAKVNTSGFFDSALHS